MFSTSWMNLPDVAADGEPKATPPKATPKILPRPLILKPAQVTFHKNDSLIVKYVRTKFKFAELQNLEEIDFRKLNISSTGFLPLVEVLPKDYIPPSSWLFDSQGLSEPSKLFEISDSEAVLSNGMRPPDRQKFYGFAKELVANLSAIYRSLRRDTPPQGLENIKIVHFRKFWIALHNVGKYWDDSLDPPEKTTELEGDKHAKLSADEKTPDDVGMDVDSLRSDDGPMIEPSVDNNYTYTGRRTSTGSQMGSIASLNLAEAFLEPIMYAFGCHFDQVSQGTHNLFFVGSMTTCINTKLIFSKPKDPKLARQGVLEGPIAVLHAHASVDFGSDGYGEIIMFIRELKAILLCAQQRSRENEQAFYPGSGDWWGLARGKWGHALNNGVEGLPGEAIGEPLSDIDLFPGNASSSARLGKIPTTSLHHEENFVPSPTIVSDPIVRKSANSTDLTDSRFHDSTQDEDIIILDADEGSSKVAPLTGSELESRLMQSTLAYTSKSEASENSPDSPSDRSSESDTSSVTLNVQDLAAKKKRSFGTFSSHGDSHNSNGDTTSIDDGMEIVLDKDVKEAEFTKDSAVVDALTSQPDSATDAQNLPVDREHETNKNEWYKSMLQGLRKKSEFEQRARRNGVKMANQPAKNPFPPSHKNLKRIGMHPSTSQDEIYLISMLNHHIAFVHVKIDQKFMDWLSPSSRERARVVSLKKDTSTWWGIPSRRSRWYDLFDEQDRVEALRAAWAIFGRMMAETNM